MTVNVPLPAGTPADSYLAAFGRVALPVLKQFDPDWLLISAGYDAHEDDPLGELNVRSTDYARLAAAMAEIVSANRRLSWTRARSGPWTEWEVFEVDTS